MRGAKFFNEQIKDDGLVKAARKGRSDRLVAKRNECLVARSFYYGYYKNKVYDEMLQLLEAEFFLSKVTISQILQAHSEQIVKLKEKKRSLFFFQSRWEHLRW